jgi:two-component system CheB/CheR fusion protein
LEQSQRDLWEALQEMEQARAEAEAATLAKDHFMAVLSHELRTPLTPVLMAVHALSRRKDMPPTAQEALGDDPPQHRDRARISIDDLLDVTRLTHGKLELVRVPMDANEAVERAIDISRPDIEAKGQQLIVSMKAGEHQIHGDIHRLQQVFWNLLKNASKFTPEGGQIWLTTSNVGGCFVAEVRDTGIGFEPEAGERIFTPFEQASRAVTREFGGLGLGLAISKAVMDAHNGTLSAKSAGLSLGATFRVELPLLGGGSGS